MQKEPRNRKRKVRDDSDRGPVTIGSGDVFLDLGITLTPEEKVKLAIAQEITRTVNVKGYTQAKAASIIGTDQAKISRISRGLVDGFSAEKLMTFLLLLGVDVDIHTSNSVEKTGRVTVHGLMSACG